MSNVAVFKVNRPSWQAKSGFVQSVLNQRDQISSWLCTAQNPSGKAYERLVRNFAATNLRPVDADKIFKQVPGWIEAERKKITKEDMGTEDHVYFLAWERAYGEANRLLDKYYFISGNQISWGLIAREGYTIDDKLVEFIDVEANDEESQILEAEADGATVRPAGV